jgi:RNA polymerase-binding transcription factor DksA
VPLTAEQRSHLQQRLLEERERVIRALRRFEEESNTSEREVDGDITAMPLHMADLGTDTMQREFEASLAARDTRVLGEIDEALRRLYREPERFGRCENTGEEIPFARLDIIPWARTCEPRRAER